MHVCISNSTVAMQIKIKTVIWDEIVSYKENQRRWSIRTNIHILHSPSKGLKNDTNSSIRPITFTRSLWPPSYRVHVVRSFGALPQEFLGAPSAQGVCVRAKRAMRHQQTWPHEPLLAGVPRDLIHIVWRGWERKREGMVRIMCDVKSQGGVTNAMQPRP